MAVVAGSGAGYLLFEQRRCGSVDRKAQGVLPSSCLESCYPDTAWKDRNSPFIFYKPWTVVEVYLCRH
jgi:hypothetical protein